MLINTAEYLSIIENIKKEIKDAQYRATIHVNSDLLLLYYDIGTVINEYKTWGNKFIDNLSYDIQIAFPERKGYSVRNLKYMAKFAARFSDRKIVQEVLAQITWYHNIALMDKVKTAEEHIWYANATVKNGWSRNVPGLLALFVMTAGPHGVAASVGCYAVGLVICYIMGFIVTNAMVSVEDVANCHNTSGVRH